MLLSKYNQSLYKSYRIEREHKNQNDFLQVTLYQTKTRTQDI